MNHTQNDEVRKKTKLKDMGNKNNKNIIKKLSFQELFSKIILTS